MASKAKARSTQSLKEAILKRPMLALFVAELVTNGGDASAAAVAVGWKEATGRSQLLRYPEIRQKLKAATEAVATSVVADWGRMHRSALNVFETALTQDDWRIRLDAAKEIVQRVEGRPRQGVDLTLLNREDEQLDSVRYRFAHAVALAYGWGLERALQYADEHPESVQEYWEGVSDQYGNPAEA